jgi:hypothetical protein
MLVKSIYSKTYCFVKKMYFLNTRESLKQNRIFIFRSYLFSKSVLFTSSFLPSNSLYLYYIKMCSSIGIFGRDYPADSNTQVVNSKHKQTLRGECGRKHWALLAVQNCSPFCFILPLHCSLSWSNQLKSLS